MCARVLLNELRVMMMLATGRVKVTDRVCGGYWCGTRAVDGSMVGNGSAGD